MILAIDVIAGCQPVSSAAAGSEPMTEPMTLPATQFEERRAVPMAGQVLWDAGTNAQLPERIDLTFLFKTQPTPQKYDARKLLASKIPSSYQNSLQIDDAIIIGDYTAVESNRRNVDVLLSAVQIPFFVSIIDHTGFGGNDGVILIVVSKAKYQEAFSVLTAAENAGELKRRSESLFPD
jgi:hypothetical protein